MCIYLYIAKRGQRRAFLDFPSDHVTTCRRRALLRAAAAISKRIPSGYTTYICIRSFPRVLFCAAPFIYFLRIATVLFRGEMAPIMCLPFFSWKNLSGLSAVFGLCVANRLVTGMFADQRYSIIYSRSSESGITIRK